MAISSASATFTRYAVQDPTGKDFWSFVDKGLKAGRFKGVSEEEAQGAGFASWDDLFDTTFDYSSYHKAEYVAFQYRADRRKIPPILMRQQLREAVEEYRKENEGRWPSKREKEVIRDKVLERLMARVLPHPSACEVVWNPKKDWMIAGSTSRRMLDTLGEHLESHLKIRPVPLYHVQWALRVLPKGGSQLGALASLVSPESVEARVEGRFLGCEFLTWLWFLLENQGGTVQFSEGREAEIHLGERLTLSRPDDIREKIVCTTPTVALYEARTALQRGKMVEQLELLIVVGEKEYAFKLDSELWAVRGLKCPRQMPARDDGDPDGRFLEKMYFIEEVFACLDVLYERFLMQRLTREWGSKTLPAMKRWTETGED